MGSHQHRSASGLTLKERRQRLFRTGKPMVRDVIYQDLAWLWTAARKNGSDLTPEEFSDAYEPWLASFEKMSMLEDFNTEFEDRTGPVGLVVAHFDGWVLEPHVNWFPWVTKRNILRCSVAYLAVVAYSRKIGVIRIHSDTDTSAYFERLSEYLPIARCGHIPHGRPNGEDIIFAMKGKKVGKDGKITVRRRRAEARISRDPETSSSSANG